MKVETKYTSIESVTYEFTKSEVREALMKAHGIKMPNFPKFEFDLGEDALDRNDNPVEYPTTLVIHYAKQETTEKP
jgi:hypothetical protein